MDKLLKLREERAKSVERMEAILSKEGDLDEAEVKEFEDVEAAIKAMDESIKRLETLEAAKAKTVVPAEPAKGADGLPHIEVTDPDKGVKGAVFSKITRALAVSKGVVPYAADFAAKTFGEQHPATKALATGIGSAGGFLVPEQYSSDIIELLRAVALVRRAGARTLSMNGTTMVPRINSGTAASYVGENSDIKSTGMTFGQIRLTSRKLAAVVPISNDLLRSPGPNADAIVLDDLLASMANAEDQSFLRGDGTGNAPKGILHWMNAGNSQASAGATAANIETDVQFLIGSLINNNVRMINPCWMMPPRSKLKLEFLKDAVTNVLTFPEVSEKGQLKGYPIFTSNNIPINLGGGSATEVYFVDMADVLIGEEMGVEVKVSEEASYNDGTQLVSAFSQDQTVVRVITKHDICMRHDRSAAVITGATY